MALFEFFGVLGATCLVLAVFFAAIKKFKLHKIFAFAAVASVLTHVGIRFLG